MYKSAVKIWCLLLLWFAAQWLGRISRTVTSCLETSKPEVTIYTTKFNIKNFYVLLAQSTRGADRFVSPTRKHTSSEALQKRRRFQQHRDASCYQVFFFLKGKAPKEIHANLTET